MNMPYSRHNLEDRERWVQRFFEILPGALSWSILLGLTALSCLRPTWAIVFILAFDLYWLLFLLYTTILLCASYFILSTERHTDWLMRARELRERIAEKAWRPDSPKPGGLRGWMSERMHKRAVRALIKSGATVPDFDAIYHVIIIPTLTEGTDVLEPGIRSLLEQDFPGDRIIVMFALEERASSSVKEAAWDLHRKHYDRFLGFYVSPHPAGVEGESAVKGANITYAARMAGQVLTQRNIPETNVIVTCLDADSILHPHYLSCLTYHFMACPQRERASFQPMPVYTNNVWDAPAVACILDIASSFFLLVEATDPGKLVNCSSHSIGFSALRAAGFWPVDMVSDDSSMFWKAFLHFEGDYRVVPMYITLAKDVVQSDTLWRTVKILYLQKRRWAWGIENFPVVMRGFLQCREIPLHDKITHGFKMLYKHVAWATWAFLLLLIGWMPGAIGLGGYDTSVAYYMAPVLQSTIFRFAALGLIATIVLSMLHLPRAPAGYPILRWLRHIAAWLWAPIAATVLSSLPALDAQTRLMLGKDLAFTVTDKKRNPSPPPASD